MTQQNDFKLVPECLDDVTVEWCDKVLHKDGCISDNVSVSNIEKGTLASDANDSDTGGGLSGSPMYKVKFNIKNDSIR